MVFFPLGQRVSSSGRGKVRRRIKERNVLMTIYGQQNGGAHAPMIITVLNQVSLLVEDEETTWP